MSLSHLPKDQRQQYERTGNISSAAFMNSSKHDVLGFPFNPYDYQQLLSAEAIGSVPPAAQGTRVAIIGAGAAGLCAAYELLKVGLVPVIYEASNRIGGRVFSCPIAGDPHSVLELGAMRVPTEQKLFGYYQDTFQMRSVPFPNPGTTDTMLWFEDEQHLWRPGTELPKEVEQVTQKFAGFLEGAIKKAGGTANPTPAQLNQTWINLVGRFEQQSLLGAMTSAGKWTHSELSILGALGAGTGGLAAQLQVASLEMFRAALGDWLNDRMILGNDYGVGLASLTETFWAKPVKSPKGTASVKEAQDNEAWRPKVVAIRATGNGVGVEIEDESGHSERFAATILTCTTRAAELGIDIDERLLSTDVWGAIRRIHYVSSSKIMCSSKTKFWQDEGIPAVTLTDRPTRASYFMDYGDDTDGGALLLAYCWGDDSNKLLGQSEEQQIEMCRNVLGDLYGDKFTRQELSDFQVVSWQDEPGYNGAFRLSYAAQYKDHNALFNQARASVESGSKAGFFLSGEGVSWEGGWIEGALQSGLDAACCTINLLGGELSVN